MAHQSQLAAGAERQVPRVAGADAPGHPLVRQLVAQAERQVRVTLVWRERPDLSDARLSASRWMPMRL